MHTIRRTEAFMIRLFFICLASSFLCGCGGRYFTNLGNGVAVPTADIEDYAKASRISRDDARKRMLEESNRKKQTQDGN